MKVPIYPRDIEPGKGVFLLAELVKTDWPESKSISITAAQNLINRCLGYSCLREIRESLAITHECPPSLNSLRDQFQKSIDSELREKECPMKFNTSELIEKLQTMSLKNLTTYRYSFGFLGLKPSERALMRTEDTVTGHQWATSSKAPTTEQPNSQSKLSPSTIKQYVDAIIRQCRTDESQTQEIAPFDCGNCSPNFFKVRRSKHP